MVGREFVRFRQVDEMAHPGLCNVRHPAPRDHAVGRTGVFAGNQSAGDDPVAVVVRAWMHGGSVTRCRTEKVGQVLADESPMRTGTRSRMRDDGLVE